MNINDLSDGWWWVELASGNSFHPVLIVNLISDYVVSDGKQTSLNLLFKRFEGCRWHKAHMPGEEFCVG